MWGGSEREKNPCSTFILILYKYSPLDRNAVIPVGTEKMYTILSYEEIFIIFRENRL